MSTSPLAEVADFLIKNQISFIPILPGEKRPGAYVKGKWIGLDGWTDYAHRFPNKEEIELWKTWPNAGVGLVTGGLSKIIALDFDNHLNLLEDAVTDLDFCCVKKGAKGFTAFFKYSSEVNKKWSYKGETVLELLSDGRQTVIPPSIHPSTNKYFWEPNRGSLELLCSKNLPELPAGFAARIDRIFQNPIEQKKEIKVSEDILKALSFIPADDYALWIKIGMALRSELGSAGMGVWDSWSKKSAKYNQSEISKKWASFATAKNVSIASVFYFAKEYGYKDSPIPEKKQETKKYLTRELVLGCPGVPGEIAKWINENSLYPQPELALAASLVAVGCLKGHRVKGETNLRTNLLAVGIAPSGAGKSRALDLIEELFKAAGVEELFSGKPKSDAGLLKSLSDNSRKLIIWDEIGLSLAEMTNIRSQTHKAAILSRCMELFSKAGGRYMGDEYANHDGKQDRTDIDQPCLCVYGASTPLRFFESLSGSHAIDGFAARWLIFETLEPFPKRREIGALTIPPELILAVQNLERMSTNVNPSGNISRHLEINPAVVKFDERAKSRLIAAWDFFDQKRESAITESAQAIWGRACEHVQKICLVVAEKEINFEICEWAIELVTQIICYTIDALSERVSDNSIERNLNKVLKLIKSAKNQEISASELTKRTQFLSSRERNDIIESLISSDQIEIRKEKTCTRAKIIFSVARD